MSKEKVAKLNEEELELVNGGVIEISSAYVQQIEPDGTGKEPPDVDNR